MGPWFVIGQNTRTMSKLKNVLYVSSAIRKFTKDELHGHLKKFRKNNEKTGISGVLVYQEGNFLQFIEGPIAQAPESVPQ